MVPEGIDDGEGDIIAAVRGAVGPDVPIAVTLDFHGNGPQCQPTDDDGVGFWRRLHRRAAFRGGSHPNQ